MEKIIGWILGYVVIVVEGEQIERFLNLCKGRGISIKKLICLGERKLQAVLSVGDFWKLQPIQRKTKVHIHILEKHGLPFFFLRCKKRKAFFLGIFLCICILFFLSGRIWNIHIAGNKKNSTPEILEFLEENGIYHGISKKKVNCSQIASMVRNNYPEITWVSAKMEGTRLILTIQEGILSQEEKKQENPCSLIADVGGTIVKMVTRSGTPLVHTGEICKKGDILVLGRLDYRNDSQEIYRYEYVHADADIYVQHELSYYNEFPLAYEAQVPVGKEENSFYIKLGSFYLQFGKTCKAGQNCIAIDYPLHITENFFLPVSMGKIKIWDYQIQEKIYTEDEAKKLALEKLHLYEENLIEKGVQISTNNVKIEIDHKSCISRGTLLVIEKTGEEAPVQIQSTPQLSPAETEGQ